MEGEADFDITMMCVGDFWNSCYIINFVSGYLRWNLQI